MTNHFRFTTGPFHFTERPQFSSIGFQSGLHFGPFQTFMAVQVFLKPGFLCCEKFFTPAPLQREAFASGLF